MVHNLRYQHAWTALRVHTQSPLVPHSQLPRAVVSGLPPRRVYVHPDEQEELLREHGSVTEDTASRGALDVQPDREWVLPAQLAEQWALADFAGLFDPLSHVPPEPQDAADEAPGAGVTLPPPSPGKWRAKAKRALMAVVDDDSTVVYYVVHDGIVKPRQN